jgi:hypothetical protein
MTNSKRWFLLLLTGKLKKYEMKNAMEIPTKNEKLIIV